MSNYKAIYKPLDTDKIVTIYGHQFAYSDHNGVYVSYTPLDQPNYPYYTRIIRINKKDEANIFTTGLGCVAIKNSALSDTFKFNKSFTWSMEYIGLKNHLNP